MKVHQLIWASRATRPFSTEELDRLVSESRRMNSIHGITGTLIYDAGGFIQVLEGDEVAVEALFSKIARDPRHREISVLDRGPVDSRRFPDWPMGRLELTPSVRSMPGISELLQDAARGGSPRR